MIFILFNLFAVGLGQPPLNCDNLTALIEANSKYGKDGVFNTTYFPDQFKDLVGLHIPTVTMDGVRGKATMTLHPQTADHYITDLWVFDERRRMIHCEKKSATQSATMDFFVPTHTGVIHVLEHCNLHGVWEHPPIELRCDDLRRLIEDNRKYNKTGIFTKDNYPAAFKDLVGLHIPKITLSADNKTATVTVSGHPMVEEHHITDIWVLDQRGQQLGCDRLHAGDKATLEIVIPEGVHELIAIEHCNLHGVWGADPVRI